MHCLILSSSIINWLLGHFIPSVDYCLQVDLFNGKICQYINSPPSCDYDFCQWSVASPSELLDWQVRYLDIYIFYVYGINK